MSIIFVFLDGFGLGGPDQTNPYRKYPSPFFHRLLGAPLEQGLIIDRPTLLLKGIDAGLGIAGIPQSATGQTALFTGINAPALVGEHLGAYPNAVLRHTIAEHSILKQAVERNRRAMLANAYSPLYWQLVEEGRRRHSASTLTCLAAGLPFPGFDDLENGRAVYWDITHSTVRLRYSMRKDERPKYRRPVTAGRILASLALGHDLILFESFLPDMVGHGKLPHTTRWTVYVLDAFFQGVVSGLRSYDSLVISSDHGNFEQMESRGHTMNPVPLLVIGPAAPLFRPVEAITEVTPAIVDTL